MNLKKVLMVVFMVICVLAVAGCGEEEKYNNAKKELVTITENYTFKNFKATEADKAVFEEAYKKAEAKLAEMEKYSSSETKLTNDYLQAKQNLERGKDNWNMRLAEYKEFQKAKANSNKTMRMPLPFEKYQMK